MEQTRTAIVVGIAILSTLILLCSPAACTMHKQKLISDAIASGKDPIAVRCALEFEGSTPSSMCIVKAAQK